MTDDPRPPIDGPTAMSPAEGDLGPHPDDPTQQGLTGYGPTAFGPVTAQPDEPTLPEQDELRAAPPDEPTPADRTSQEAITVSPPPDEPTLADPTSEGEPRTAPPDEPTLAAPPSVAWFDGPSFPEAEAGQSAEPPSPARLDEPTLAEPTQRVPPAPTWSNAPFSVDGPTVAEPVALDEPTVANVDPTITGPTVASWPFDQFEPPLPQDLVWQPDSAPVEQPRTSRNPAYYVALGAAVVLVVGLVAFAALVTVKRPTQAVAGTGSAAIPVVTSSNQPSPASTTQSTTSSAAPEGPYAELASHPLSTETTRMPDATCALPRFDPADDKQAAFYEAAKVCADAAWGPVLQAAGVDDAEVKLVTVTGPQQTQSCGDLAPTSPPTECDGTVYMTPAYLRDTEQNGRYPGKYFGVFLREYARALQFSTGLEQLAAAVPNGSSADIDQRMDQQATCLAGVAGGSMSGRGAVDANITNEIHERLTTVDAPPDAQSLLDKGLQQRTPAACNTWTK